MCSDGKVSKFVNEHYLAKHDTAPYVETIGILREADDECGKYILCTDSLLNRTATKLRIEFPLKVHDQAALSEQHEIVAGGESCATPPNVRWW